MLGLADADDNFGWYFLLLYAMSACKHFMNMYYPDILDLSGPTTRFRVASTGTACTKTCSTGYDLVKSVKYERHEANE